MPPRSLLDFKELLTLPIQGRSTGESFFATTRMELSCFGYVTSEHFNKKDGSAMLAKKYILVLSNTFDHISTRANHCIDICLNKRSTPPALLNEINIISDAAGHLRGIENFWHHCVKMVGERVRILVGQIKELIGKNTHEDDDAAFAHWLDTSQMLADVLTKVGCEREPLLAAC